jgi:hypothetical protein
MKRRLISGVWGTAWILIGLSLAWLGFQSERCYPLFTNCTLGKEPENLIGIIFGVILAIIGIVKLCNVSRRLTEKGMQ